MTHFLMVVAQTIEHQLVDQDTEVVIVPPLLMAVAMMEWQLVLDPILKDVHMVHH